MAETKTQHFLDLAGRPLSDSELSALNRATDRTAYNDGELRIVMNHKDFPEHSTALLEGLKKAAIIQNGYMDSIRLAFSPDVDYELTEALIDLVGKPNDKANLEFAVKYAERNSHVNLYDAVNCMYDIVYMLNQNHQVAHTKVQDFSDFSAQQIHTLADVFKDISEASQRADEGTLIPESVEARTNVVIDCGIFDTVLTPAQMWAIGHYAGVEIDKFDSNDRVKIINTIKEHPSKSFVLYENLEEPFTGDYTSKDAWQFAKNKLYNKCMINENGNPKDDALAIAESVCEELGMSNEEMDDVTHWVSHYIVEPSGHVFNEQGLSNFCDMLMENIPFDDACDYYKALQDFSPTNMDDLYNCINHNLPKDITTACLIQNLIPMKVDEIICAHENGCPPETCTTLCEIASRLTVSDLCMARQEIEQDVLSLHGQDKIPATIQKYSEKAKQIGNKPEQIDEQQRTTEQINKPDID